MFSLICAWTNGWTNYGEAGDLRRHRVYFDVTVMKWPPFLHKHDGTITWKRLPHNWSFVKWFHRWQKNSSHKGLVIQSLMFDVIVSLNTLLWAVMLPVMRNALTLMWRHYNGISISINLFERMFSRGHKVRSYHGFGNIQWPSTVWFILMAAQLFVRRSNSHVIRTYGTDHEIIEEFGARSRHIRHGQVIASHSFLWGAITYPCLKYRILTKVPNGKVTRRLGPVS